MNHTFFTATVILAVLVSGCNSAGRADRVYPAITRDNALETKVDKTLKAMTLEEKAGQMVQISLEYLLAGPDSVSQAALDTVIGKYKVGSILNVPGRAISREQWVSIIRPIQEKSMATMGIPCLYGLDQIHGATYISDGTFFPQEINIGATFDPSFATAMGEVIGYETRAAMIPWVFSPVMDLSRNSAWPRNWESWGEDPYMQSVMSAAEVKAIQGDDPNHIPSDKAAVSIKHYMGYGNPATGKDRTPASISASDLRDKYFAPFKASIEAGALTVMVNSASINGVPTHANKELITGWLKEGLDWDGMVVTDWADLDNLYERDHVAVDKKDAIRIGINAGIDMIMEPKDPKAAVLIAELVKEGGITRSRIDDAVRRILRVKYRLGLFDSPVWNVTGYDRFNSAESVTASYRATVESEVLLKNEDGLLPLKEGTRILLAGPNANSIRSLNGGWSYTWQGSGDPAFVDKYNTIKEAFEKRFGASNVDFVEGVRYKDHGNWADDEIVNIDAAVSAARRADVVVVCIGENSYCETPGNINDLNISANQFKLARELAATKKPFILILNEGRPRILGELERHAEVVIDMMLPGVYGGDALAALMAGDENFSAKLPFTYPRYVNSIHTYDYKVCEHRESMAGVYNYDAVMDVQWPFGAGISYTTFEYSGLKSSAESFKSGDILAFTFDITNTGSVTGKESALLYSSDLVAGIIPDVKRLRAFGKYELKPGEKKTVTLTVPADDLAYVGADGRWILEEGDFRIGVGGLSTTVKCSETKVWNAQNR